MDSEKILQEIKSDLTGQGLDCILQSGTEPPSRLLVYIGEDVEGRARAVELKALANQGELEQLKQSSRDSVYFQMDSVFPFTVDDLSMGDVAQFLNFLNLQVEIPGFFLNYVDNTIVYRYVLLTENQHIPKKILSSLIGTTMMFQDIFGQTLERLAKGKISFVDILQEIQAVLAKATSFPRHP